MVWNCLFVPNCVKENLQDKGLHILLKLNKLNDTKIANAIFSGTCTAIALISIMPCVSHAIPVLKKLLRKLFHE